MDQIFEEQNISFENENLRDKNSQKLSEEIKIEQESNIDKIYDEYTGKDNLFGDRMDFNKNDNSNKVSPRKETSDNNSPKKNSKTNKNKNSKKYNENIKKYFREALSFIESSKKIYVHCWAGVSRSASIVIAYFMWKQKLNFIESKKLVERGRECINPNEGFIKQLMEFEKFLSDNNFKLSRKFK